MDGPDVRLLRVGIGMFGGFLARSFVNNTCIAISMAGDTEPFAIDGLDGSAIYTAGALWHLGAPRHVTADAENADVSLYFLSGVVVDSGTTRIRAAVLGDRCWWLPAGGH